MCLLHRKSANTLEMGAWALRNHQFSCCAHSSLFRAVAQSQKKSSSHGGCSLSVCRQLLPSCWKHHWGAGGDAGSQRPLPRRLGLQGGVRLLIRKGQDKNLL